MTMKKFEQIDFVLCGSLGKYYRKNISDFQKYIFKSR